MCVRADLATKFNFQLQRDKGLPEQLIPFLRICYCEDEAALKEIDVRSAGDITAADEPILQHLALFLQQRLARCALHKTATSYCTGGAAVARCAVFVSLHLAILGRTGLAACADGPVGHAFRRQHALRTNRRRPAHLSITPDLLQRRRTDAPSYVRRAVTIRQRRRIGV